MFPHIAGMDSTGSSTLGTLDSVSACSRLTYTLQSFVPRPLSHLTVVLDHHPNDLVRSYVVRTLFLFRRSREPKKNKKKTKDKR